MAFGFPVMLGVIFGIVFLSNKSTDAAVEQLKKQQFSLEITDRSGLVNPSIVAALGAKIVDDRSKGINDVKTGKLDSYVYYPQDLSKDQIEVYGRDAGIFNNGRYDSVAGMLLSLSVDQTVRPEIRAVVQKTTKTQVTTYRDGVVYDPFKEMILPGVFLVLFYMLIAFFGGQMLTSTTEEKENRVIEMILTTVEARTLIIGKIISLVVLALFQAVIIVVPALIIYLLFHNQLQLPAIDLTTLPVNWLRIGTGVAIFSLSFILFTGLLVLIGSAVPTAKEAGGFMGLIMMLIFGPLYAASLFISAPDSLFVRFMSLFPLTAPIPLLLRNAVGNLAGWEVALAIPILMLSSVCVLYLAVRVFRYGVLEYSRKLSLREIFTRG
jgi:ABC-2 type transport system permease protein